MPAHATSFLRPVFKGPMIGKIFRDLVHKPRLRENKKIKYWVQIDHRDYIYLKVNFHNITPELSSPRESETAFVL